MAKQIAEKSIKIVSERYVRPKPEVEDECKQTYHLGPVDLFMLSIDPMQKGLLYALDRSKSVCDLVERLEVALSIALVHFYPLAGRFAIRKYPRENACSIFIDCNKGPGARLIHATALDLTISDVLSDIDVSIVHPFFDLGEKSVNYDGLTRALLTIQVTELQDGVFIGFSMNHSVGDGTSFTHFIHMLSEIYRTNECSSSSSSNITNISRVPILNYRPWLSSKHDVALVKFPVLDLEELIYRGYDPGPLRERVFHFSSKSMVTLKARANRECGTNNVVSSFQALSALVWRSIIRAQDLPLDKQTSCVLAADARSRLDPPISDDYFGCFLSKAEWACEVDELLGNSLGWAAMNLCKAVSTIKGETILDFYDKFMNNPLVLPRGFDPSHYTEGRVTIGGSSRFDVYGAEFGLRRGLAARMGGANKANGKVTAIPGCEGEGSVDLDICLRPLVMNALEVDHEFMSFVSLS